MKNLVLFFIVALFNHKVVFSQGCLPEGITFTSQSQIDSFPINYPGCTHIEGDVFISSNDISNLLGLDRLTIIGGDLKISYNSKLSDLTGLEKLFSIGGSLIITSNPILEKINSLDNLTLIGSDIRLGNLSWLGYAIGNPALLSLSGLEGIKSLRNLEIIGLDTLVDLSGLDNLQTLSGSLLIIGNELLSSLSALNKLSHIGGELRIGNYSMYGPVGNSSLFNLSGLEGLTEIGGDLVFLGGKMLNLEGLNSLRTIGNDFILQDNNFIANLQGLDSLTSITGNFRIGPYPGTGGEEFIPHGNPSLVSLAGLENMVSIGGDLVINDNISLAACEIKTVCNYLSSFHSEYYISDNASGCNTIGEVKAACAIGIYENQGIDKVLSFYPNPASNNLTIETICNSDLYILNPSGQQLIYRQVTEPKTVIDISNLAGGMYFIRLTDSNTVSIGRIIKQ